MNAKGTGTMITCSRRLLVAMIATGALTGLTAANALAAAPTVTTNPASNITQTAATLNGTENPNGSTITDCHYDFGTDTSYGQTFHCDTGIAGTSDRNEPLQVSGLAPRTTYHYRIVATNADGTVTGSDQTFTTTGTPVVGTHTATNVTLTSATLNGTVNPEGGAVSDCHFDYGTDTGYGQSAPCVESPGSGTDPVDVHADVSGLTPKTPYHFRLVATNDQGTTNGADLNTKCFCYFDFASTSASLSTLQAGGHPDFITRFIFNGDPDPTLVDGHGQPYPWAKMKTFTAELPPGMTGNPEAFPKCSAAVFAHLLDFPPRSTEQCPQDSQVGIASPGGYNNIGPAGQFQTPIYLLDSPSDSSVARFGFYISFVPVILEARVDAARDYALSTSALPAAATIPITGAVTTIWGAPTDSSHDGQRGTPWDPFFCRGTFNCIAPKPSGLPAPTAFLSNPTSCGPVQTRFEADTYQGTSATPTDVPLGTISGCDKLPFDPTVNLTPTSREADSPSGIDVSIGLDQSGLQDPSRLATAHLKKAVVTLPQGVALNPSAADGLQGCTEAQIGMISDAPIRFNADDPTCPDGSNVGTAKITTPVLPEPLEGSLYLADQHDNPFGQPPTLAGYLVAKGKGVIIKLAGRFDLDPNTGQVTATFDNNPQQPFSDLELHFKSGPHGVLVLPAKCGTYAIDSQLTPWSGTPPVDQTTNFTVDQGCDTGGFTPALNAGVTNPVAGSSSSFVLQLTRQDGEQNIDAINATLPPGLLAKLAGVPLCPDAMAASGDCPAGSRVGSTTVGTGVGPEPLYIPQAGKAPTAVYLAGPYKGAPYSLVIRVPAQAGPFDLGTVAVRTGIYVDPTTAQVTVVSDPLPQIIQGIPLPYRDIRVAIDRPGFIQAPTSCNPMSIAADVTGVPLGGPVAVNAQQVGYAASAGAVAHLASRFQVGDCSSLGFSPKLKIGLTGKGKTRSGDHPTLTATLTNAAGQANIRSAKVALPLSLALDPNNSQHVCDYDTAQAVHGGPVGCPASTIVGTATALTPLLSQPLSGPVYLVQGIRFGAGGQRIHTLPSLLIPLRGQIALDLRAQSAVSGGKLVTTFSTIPDAAVSKFTLKINGGRKGILVITGRGKTICGKKQVSDATFGAQSGKTMSPKVTMGTPCAKAKHRPKKHGKKGKARSAKHALRTPVVDRLRW